MRTFDATISMRPPTFEEVYVTDELDGRPTPAIDHRQIKQAIQELAAHMVDGPEEVLPRFVELAMEIGGGVSAGISVATLDATPPIFTWAFLKGSLAVFNGATTPRNDSPCGVTLDQNRAVLTRHSERLYSWIAETKVVLPEVLLVPLHRGTEKLGTLWVVSDELAHFNRAHVDAITEIAAFVSIALRMHQTETRLSKALVEQEALAKEMSHRVKNVFSIVDGMVHFSTRSAETKDDLARALTGRVRALATAHGLIRRSFSDPSAPRQASDLGELVRAILRPHEGATNAPSRISAAGPEIVLGEHATNAVALVLHELATNAAKYGALSRDDGAVDIAWSVDPTHVAMTWKERGGPLVSGAPSTVGFGTRLVTDTIEGGLGGSQRREWLPEGVEIALRLPLERLKR